MIFMIYLYIVDNMDHVITIRYSRIKQESLGFKAEYSVSSFGRATCSPDKKEILFYS